MAARIEDHRAIAGTQPHTPTHGLWAAPSDVGAVPQISDHHGIPLDLAVTVVRPTASTTTQTTTQIWA